MDAPAVIARIIKRSDIGTGCWVWTGLVSKWGYGRIGVVGKVQYVHRIAYRILVRDIPPERLVLHRCDNPPCWRPSHLYDGTNADNSRDKMERGRARFPTGDAHWTRRRPEHLLRGESHGRWLGNDTPTVMLSAGRTKAGESVCERCGAVYLTRLERVGEQRFCSRACQTKALGAARTAAVESGDFVITKSGARLRAAPMTCEQCGSGFLVELSRLKRGNTRYCSKRCIGLANAAKRWGHG